jgi:hypothetical protein
MVFMKRTLLLALAIFASQLSVHAQSQGSQILAEINLARTQPQVYSGYVAERAATWRGSEGPSAAMEAVRFLQKARPLPPMQWSDGISQAALSHVVDIGTRGARGHTGSRGESPWKRMGRFGQFEGHAGENISYGYRDPRLIVISLIIDDGVRGRKHRQNLFSSSFRVAGVAVGSHAGFGTMCVMDFASGFTEQGQPRVAARATLSRSIYSDRFY